jgi:GNAT superfamily N-acetyltransferase
MNWETDRCDIHTLQHAEEKTLQNLYERSAPLPKWTGQSLNPLYISNILNGTPGLPPGGSPDRVVVQHAAHRASERDADPSAFFELYQGHPGEGDLYIGLFAVDPSWRGQRYGKELVNGIISLAASRSYETVRAAVDLKNWDALRFWIGCGFKEAVKVSGDREHSEDAYASMELVYRLPK